MAIGTTRSSSSPSTFRAAARNRSESSTRSAICCSAAAPRSSRCAMRRASWTGESSPTVSRISAASSSHSGCWSLACSAAAAGSVATISRIRSTRVKRRTCDGSSRNGSRRRRSTASASSGSARSSTPVVSRKRHAAHVTVGEHGEELVGHRRCPPQGDLAPLADPGQEARARPGALCDALRGVERELERELRGGIGREVDHAVVHHQPATRRLGRRRLGAAPVSCPHGRRAAIGAVAASSTS